MLPENSLPEIENRIEGELDFANGGFELVQWPKNGDEIMRDDAYHHRNMQVKKNRTSLYHQFYINFFLSLLHIYVRYLDKYL